MSSIGVLALNNGCKKIKPSSKLSFLSELRALEQDTEILKRLRNIRNELLSNGAYHEKNLEEQMRKLDNVRVPQDEKELVIASSETSYKLSHKLMNKYNKLIVSVNKQYRL